MCNWDGAGLALFAFSKNTIMECIFIIGGRSVSVMSYLKRLEHQKHMDLIENEARTPKLKMALVSQALPVGSASFKQ